MMEPSPIGPSPESDGSGRRTVSRRTALAGLAAAAASGSAFGRSVDSGGPAAPAGPAFSPSGPNADRYGAAEGYPVPGDVLARSRGNPWEPRHRVGAFSHIDELFATRRVARAAAPSAFVREAADIDYAFEGRRSSPDDYLTRNPVTGLLIARDDRILFESYQYGRTDSDRLVSQSMVKSIVGMLVGIAVSEGAIKSVADAAEIYVPGLRGTEYGATPIRDLLHMSSGVDFGEERDGGRDLDRLWRDMVARPVFGSPKGTIASITQFNRRIAPPGTRYRYASIEPDVLGLVLRSALGESLSDSLRRAIWEPIGAEADATWLIDAQGYEVAHFGFNAVLRDYARLGRLLAHDGAWDGRQIIPAQWMIDATTVKPGDAFLAPGRAMRNFGYGYLLWLLPGPRRQFALVGDYGQRVCIDPASKLVMVQTALEDTPEFWRLWSALTRQFGAQ